jgi:hypothetical protein
VVAQGNPGGYIEVCLAESVVVNDVADDDRGVVAALDVTDVDSGDRPDFGVDLGDGAHDSLRFSTMRGTKFGVVRFFR